MARQTLTEKSNFQADFSSQLLTPKQIQDLFQISGSTLSRWWRKGAFPMPIRQGRVRRWRQEDIAQILKSGTAETNLTTISEGGPSNG